MLENTVVYQSYSQPNILTINVIELYTSKLKIITSKERNSIPLYVSMLLVADRGVLTLIVILSYRNTFLTVYCVSVRRNQPLFVVSVVMRTS